MLILSRRTEESIFIGKDIKITILSANRGQTRIGIDAPKDIPIHREAAFKKMLAEQFNIDEEKSTYEEFFNE